MVSEVFPLGVQLVSNLPNILADFVPQIVQLPHHDPMIGLVFPPAFLDQSNDNGEQTGRRSGENQFHQMTVTK